MPLRLVPVVIAMFWALPGAVFAHHPGSHVRIVDEATLALDVTYLAPDACHVLENAAPGAPQAIVAPAGTIPVSVSVVSRPATADTGCTATPTPIEATLSLPRGGERTVQIYFLDSAGIVISTERVPVPES